MHGSNRLKTVVHPGNDHLKTVVILNTRTKILMVVTLTFFAILYNQVLVLAGLTIIAFALFLIGKRKSKSKQGKGNLRSLFVLIFSLMVIQIIFRPSGELLWHWGPIRISVEGVQYGTAASLRLLIIFLSAGFLLNISYYEFLTAFQSWKMPYELSFLMASVLQFLPILKREFLNMGEALALRGIEIRKLHLLQRLHAYQVLVFPILGKTISSLKFRVISLEMRGFRLSRNRTSLHVDKLTMIDWVVQSCLLMIIIVSVYFSLR
jgi:energy-coupling factor transporter transmembrane protein EcfT